MLTAVVVVELSEFPNVSKCTVNDGGAIFGVQNYHQSFPFLSVKSV